MLGWQGVRDAWRLGLALGAFAAVLGVVTPSAVGAVPPSSHRVSLGWDDRQGNAPSSAGLISANNRFVAFDSRATNLSRHRDTNGVRDVFVRDRRLGRTVRVSVDSHGRQANGSSRVIAISAGGRFAMFDSHASNLVEGDTNGHGDVFVRDLRLGVTRRVDVDSQGSQLAIGRGQDMSPDGRYVLFEDFPSIAESRLLLRDLRSGVTGVVPHTDTFEIRSYQAQVSAGAHFITYSLLGLGSGLGDAFRFNRVTGRTSKLLGIGSHDGVWVSDISPDGRFLLVTSEHEVGSQGCRMTDVWVRDMKKKTSMRLTKTTGGCGDTNQGVSISSDGRLVTFTSALSHFVTGDSNGVGDVFQRHTLSGKTLRLSVAPDGSQLATPSGGGSMSGLGAWALFWSRSAVVPRDTNSVRDVYSRGALP
jgi:hypothetical protein